jgi:ectoine hydroxylase-related dioxygenase (phytanoyl-CoA dioxygenase family)
VQIIPRSHHAGLINPSHDSGFLTHEQAAQHAPDQKRVYLEMKPGEVALLHNWLLHSSDVNKTDIPRRAFSVCYMDGRTRDKKQTSYTTIFGSGALTPEQLRPAVAGR